MVFEPHPSGVFHVHHFLGYWTRIQVSEKFFWCRLLLLLPSVFRVELVLGASLVAYVPYMHFHHDV